MKKKLSRRFFLKLGGLLSSLPFISSRSIALDQSLTDTAFQNEDIYHFKVGDFNCTCIKDAVRGYPLENFFKNVSRETVEGTLQNLGLPIDQVYTPFTHLIVDTGKNKVLVDTGLGGNLADYMKLSGINPAEIDSVVITHAHPDHVGGILDKDGVPIYTNAQYYIWKGEWDFWFSPSAPDIAKESQIKTAREKLGPVKDRVIFVEHDTEILPGVSVMTAAGHTPGHMIVSFTSKKETLYYTGDTVLYPLHLEHPDWLPIYDLMPDKAEISKHKVFDMIAEKKVLMVAQQFPPFPSLGHIIKKQVGWKFEPISS